ncbi:MAG: hypothetical protein ACNS62_19490 [Candidatus Cyclobacteriaceae bacterium M3_2C_046]
MDKYKLLAAEMNGFRYADYYNHLGNLHFDTILPNEVKRLEKAAQENWSDDQISRELKLDREVARKKLRKYKLAKKLIESPGLAEFLRRSLRETLKTCASISEEEQEQMVENICQRMTDLGFMLERRNQQLHELTPDLLGTTKKYN